MIYKQNKDLSHIEVARGKQYINNNNQNLFIINDKNSYVVLRLESLDLISVSISDVFRDLW